MHRNTAIVLLPSLLVFVKLLQNLQCRLQIQKNWAQRSVNSSSVSMKISTISGQEPRHSNRIKVS